jgi:hypothetical protein
MEGGVMAERELWAAVVLQAQADLDGEAYGSVLYAQAEAFFVGAGPWGASRAEVADRLDLHGDDLRRLGRATLAARALRDGPPPVVVRAVADPIPSPIPRPVVVSVCPAPAVADLRVARRHKPIPERRDRNWWIAQFMARQAA